MEIGIICVYTFTSQLDDWSSALTATVPQGRDTSGLWWHLQCPRKTSGKTPNMPFRLKRKKKTSMNHEHHRFTEIINTSVLCFVLLSIKKTSCLMTLIALTLAHRTKQVSSSPSCSSLLVLLTLRLLMVTLTILVFFSQHRQQ